MSTSKAMATTDRISGNIHVRHEHLLKHSAHIDQLRQIGLDLFNENSKLLGRVRALEQILEQEKATVRLLKAMRDADRQQRRQDSGNKRRPSVTRFVPSKRREVAMPEHEK